MDEPLRRIEGERIGHLASIRPDGAPHIVPMVFAMTDDRIVTAIDWKPKAGRRLQRLTNIEANPAVSFLVHHYSENWSELWWVRIDGEAAIHRGDRVWESAVAALVDKYEQYRHRAPEGEVIAILPTRASSWTARS